jgi:hypothetical protein
MAKFDAGSAVETLDYDFTAYGGGEGVIPEPSTKKVNQYFNEIKAIAKDVKSLQAQAKSVENIEEFSDEDAMEALDSVDMDALQDQATDFQMRMVEALVVLCGGEWVDNEPDSEGKSDGLKHVEGGSPSLEDLENLPYRVLQAFNQWLMEQIRPKRTTPAIKR